MEEKQDECKSRQNADPVGRGIMGVSFWDDNTATFPFLAAKMAFRLTSQ